MRQGRFWCSLNRLSVDNKTYLPYCWLKGQSSPRRESVWTVNTPLRRCTDKSWVRIKGGINDLLAGACQCNSFTPISNFSLVLDKKEEGSRLTLLDWWPVPYSVGGTVKRRLIGISASTCARRGQFSTVAQGVIRLVRQFRWAKMET